MSRMGHKRRNALLRAALTLSLVFSAAALSAGPARDVFQNNQKKILIIKTTFQDKVIGNGSSFIAAFGGKNFLVTNYHVISAGKFHLEINGKPIKGLKVLRANDAEDIAILTFPDIHQYEGVPLKKYEPLEGETVFALGYPAITHATDSRLTITDGLVSNSRLFIKRGETGNKRFIQISASINPGNSGGPVFGDRGQLIGMATLKWLDLSSVGAAIPTEDIINEIGRITTGPRTEQVAREQLNERFALMAASVKEKNLLEFGGHYAPSLKYNIYPRILKKAEKIHLAARVAKQKYPDDSDKAREAIASYLEDDELVFFIIMGVYLKTRPDSSLEDVLGNPFQASRLYLSSRFFMLYTRLSGGSLKDMNFQRYVIRNVRFSEDFRRADVRADVILKEKQFPIQLKFLYEWNNWYLLPSS